MKISNLYCSEMVPEETKKRYTNTHKFAVWKKVNGKAVHAIQQTEMSNDSFGWYSISLSHILCVMFDYFFLCFTAVSESDGPEIRSTCYSHIMNMFAQWIVITASQSKCTRMDYMLMHINSSSLLYLCVCVFIAYCVQYESDLKLSAHAELNIARHFFSKPKTKLTFVCQSIVIWIGFVQ